MEIVLGYHGTNQKAACSILADGFKVSSNEYDWLGDGIYFFQDAPQRAWEWAQNHYPGEEIVVCAGIQKTEWIDLLDIAWAEKMPGYYNQFLNLCQKSNIPIPTQTSGAHRLDRYVINYMCGILAQNGIQVRAVRAAFIEGRPIYPGSALYDRSHVQIAVRDSTIIRSLQVLQQPNANK